MGILEDYVRSAMNIILEEMDIIFQMMNRLVQIVKILKLKFYHQFSQQFGFFFLLYTLTSVEKTNQLFVLFKLTQKLAHILFKMNLNQESILFKLFLSYIWIFSVIFTFNISFSFSFIFINKMNDTSYFLTSNLDFELSQSFEVELIYIRVVVLFIFIAFQMFIIQLGVELFKCQQIQKSVIAQQQQHQFTCTCKTMLPQSINFFQSRQQGKSQGDVSLLFESSIHNAWIYKFALPVSLLIGLIIPMSLLWFLYRTQKLYIHVKEETNLIQYNSEDILTIFLTNITIITIFENGVNYGRKLLLYQSILSFFQIQYPFIFNQSFMNICCYFLQNKSLIRSI